MFVFRLVVIKRVNQILIQYLILLWLNRCRIKLIVLDISQRVLRIPTFLSIIAFFNFFDLLLLLIHFRKIEFCVIFQRTRDHLVYFVVWEFWFSAIVVVLLVNGHEFACHIELALLEKIYLNLRILSYLLLILLNNSLINFVKDCWRQIDGAAEDLGHLAWFNPFLW